MENIIRKIRTYYPVSDEALEALVCLFERWVFPAKITIIHAGKLDRKVYFIEKGITRSYVLHNGKEITTWFSKEGDAAESPELFQRVNLGYLASFLGITQQSLSRIRANERF